MHADDRRVDHLHRSVVRPGFIIRPQTPATSANIIEQHRGAAKYVNRILHGEKPGDLPVQTPTKFELIINLKSAKALGLTISPLLLTIADQVIE